MLVEQLSLRIQRTRNSIGNLAHEIKRPLQILSLHLDSGEDKQSAIQSFKDIQLIVDRELRRAKISGSNVVGGTFHADNPYGVYDRCVNAIGIPKTSFKALDICIIANPIKSA
ncbi:MAG: hypothetical protein KAI17_03005, partial [Thiotrichaceae bacterium]|nr:hypothetical protein [Thiotrichaceae bacterium]